MRKVFLYAVLRAGMLMAAPQLASACTTFVAMTTDAVLFANNEDSRIPYTRIWFLPAEQGKHGRVYLGFDGLGCIHPQGGVNDQGLAFDILAAPSRSSDSPLGDEPYYGTYGNLIVKVMEECGTVGEAIALFERYNTGNSWSGQYLLADRHGDAAIVEIDKIHRIDGEFLVATNFYLSQVKTAEYPCIRYKTASELLQGSEHISVDVCKKILAEVHMEGDTPTQYSNIIDLTNKTLYLYHFHNFGEVSVFNIDDELKDGRRSIELASLFPATAGLPLLETDLKEPVVRPMRIAYDGGGVSKAMDLYHYLVTQANSTYDINDWLLKVFGWELADEGKSADALEIFRLVVEEYPSSADAHEKLGWAFMKRGMKNEALKSYRRSLELDPENRTAAHMVKTLSGI